MSPDVVRYNCFLLHAMTASNLFNSCHMTQVENVPIQKVRISFSQ